MHTVIYPVQLEADDNDTILVTCRDLPELTTFGATEAEALSHATAALTATIAVYIEDRRDIPPPGRAAKGDRLVAATPLVAAKALLYTAMRRAGMSQAQLARHLGWKAPQVHRVLDPAHASRLDQIEAALAVLGHSLEVRLRPAA